MSGFVPVVRREVAERKSLLLAGLALGFVPLLAPLLPGARENASEIRQITMLILLCAFAWGAAVMLGGSVWARDLAEKRLGFYFARPISPAALFGAKLVAALALVLGASALLLLPGMLGGGLHGKWLAGGGNSVIAFLVIAGSALLIPVAHSGATVIRARDPWGALHLPLLVVLAAIVVWSGATITRAAVGPTAIAYIGIFLLLVPVVLAAAGFAQAAVGRTDALRSHRALAVAGWAPLFVLALVGAGGALWYAHPSPSSLSTLFNATASPDARFTFVSGEGRGLRANAAWGFLLDTRHPERFVRTGALVGYGDLTAFSRDGSTAAFLSVDRSGERIWRIEPTTASLRIAHLSDAGITVEETGLTAPINRRFDFALSPRGTRVAVIDGPTASVFDIATKRTLVAAKATGIRGSLLPVFTDEDRLVLTESWGMGERQPVARDLAILELDVTARRLLRTGTVSVPPTSWARTLCDRTGERMLVLGRSVSLHDARTGALIDSFGEKGGTGTFLADGRIVVVAGPAERRALRVFGRDGGPIRTIELGRAMWVQIGPQPTAGTLVLGLRGTEAGAQKSVVIDLDSGAVVKELPGIAPVPDDSFLGHVASAAAPRPLALFSSGDKSLFTVDLASGARTPLLPR